MFWSEDITYVTVAIFAAMTACACAHWSSKGAIYQAILYLDAVGISLFAIKIAQKVIIMGFALPYGPIMLGVLAPVGGGLLRDMMSHRRSFLLDPTLYGVPLLAGCIVLEVWYIFSYLVPT